VVRALTLSVLYFHTAGALLAYLLADEEVTRDELYSVGATFTVLAWAFAHLYSWCQGGLPDSFTAAVDAGDPRSWMELCSQCHHAVEHRSQRRGACSALRAGSGDARAGGGGRLHRDGASRLITLLAARKAEHGAGRDDDGVA
jgi:hypothetical protein